jgi:putative transposase
MITLAHKGTKRYQEVLDLVHRRKADRQNEIRLATTRLDLWMITRPGSRPGPG